MPKILYLMGGGGCNQNSCISVSTAENAQQQLRTHLIRNPVVFNLNDIFFCISLLISFAVPVVIIAVSKECIFFSNCFSKMYT